MSSQLPDQVPDPSDGPTQPVHLPVPFPQQPVQLPAQPALPAQQPAEQPPYPQAPYLPMQYPQTPYLPTAMPTPAPRKPRPWQGLSRRARLIAAFCIVLASVGGYFGWTALRPSPPQRNVAPFLYAMMNLASAPMVHYSGSSPGAGTSWDVSVTDGGEEYGSLTADGEKYGVLAVGGVTYVKPPQSDLDLIPTTIPVSDLQGQWLAGYGDVTSLLPQSLATPHKLEQSLYSGIKNVDALPLVGAPTTEVDGRQAVSVTLPQGVLYVAADAPYQVLRVDPAASARSSGSATSSGSSGVAAALRPAFEKAAVADGSAAGSAENAAGGADTAQTDLQPLTQAGVDQTYGDIIGQTKTLNKAPDVGVSTDYNQTGNLSCSDTNCTVTENVTTSTTSTQPAALSGSVSAVMSATVTVDGQAGGECSATQTLPINGTGTITCEDAGVAGPVAEIRAQKQEQANAEGQDISYTIDFLADVSIETMADVEAAVSQQVQAEQGEQNAADEETLPDSGCTEGASAAGDSLVRDAGTVGVCPADGTTDHGKLGEMATKSRLQKEGYTNIQDQVTFTDTDGVNFRADFVAKNPAGQWTAIEAKVNTSQLSENQLWGYLELGSIGARITTDKLAPYGLPYGSRVQMLVEEDRWLCPRCT